ncbi:MAG: imidazole glycerol phosphate synthase subunit HisH [Bacteroidetes bacterium]|nr:imidazole glycerol phosphate synthase subunit HisH [Bacteroidota bacterium]
MIVIIDYGIGNLTSVLNMFKRIGINEVCISSDPNIIDKADKILLPGVGAFDAGMENLEKSGLISLLSKRVLQDKIPTLGICLGMQLLTQKSEEGLKNGLGWIDAETVKFKVDTGSGLKVPHMGWSYINVKKQNPLIDIDFKSRFYFVHSYYVKCYDSNQSIATSVFGNEFTCAVNKDNIFGTQFHPEKSLKFGMKVLQNFAKL